MRLRQSEAASLGGGIKREKNVGEGEKEVGQREKYSRKELELQCSWSS